MSKVICRDSGVEFESKNGWIDPKIKKPANNEEVIAVIKSKQCSRRYTTCLRYSIDPVVTKPLQKKEAWLQYEHYPIDDEETYDIECWMPMPKPPDLSDVFLDIGRKNKKYEKLLAFVRLLASDQCYEKFINENEINWEAFKLLKEIGEEV